jgi:hypothetical protein
MSEDKGQNEDGKDESKASIESSACLFSSDLNGAEFEHFYQFWKSFVEFKPQRPQKHVFILNAIIHCGLYPAQVGEF